MTVITSHYNDIIIMSASTIHDSHVVVFFDFETTGLDVLCDDIIEIGAEVDPVSAARCTRAHNIATSFDSLVRLDQRSTIDQSATRVHGITTRDLSGAESFNVVWSRFITWLDSWRSATGKQRLVLVAHNCYGYDQLMLNNTLKRGVGKLPTWIQFSDSLVAIRKACDDECFTYGVRKYESCALQKLGTQLGVNTGQSHRALSDVRLLISVISKLNAPVIYAHLLKIIQPKMIGVTPLTTDA